MSPDTPDPERAADRPSGRPETSARPPSGPDRPSRDAPAGSGGTSAGPADGPTRAGTAGAAGVDGPAEGFAPLDAGHPPGADPLAGYPGLVGGAAGWPPATDRPTDRLRAVGLTLAVALLVSVLGAPLGVLWAAVAPGTPVRKTAEGAIYATPQPEQPVAADGWFSLLGLGFGLLVAIALWVLLRRRRGPVGLLAGVLGGIGAAVAAWQVGRRIGLGTYHRLLATAPDGTAFTKPADLRAGGIDWYALLPVPHGNLLLPAFGAAVMYTLLAGWSRWPSLRPEPELGAGWPGPGPDGGWPGPGPDGGWPPGPGISSAPGDQPAR
ncbi:DUF2567 domain-containing protein [Micromonospora sp. PPF5-17]|uniref:DUF2567 domain-containing protein n=1 Tax=Micromonospora solifontis TaxID=2487138 RepID=A0ABX9WG70_9ACTN|nr:DUF2567 domain-containing protein [Micromonospora solifontis]NES36956.1 DUF2567 domain-containing protein [Micromonospora solifontis]RNL98878.1 DUF2567 domain-containing protein [Micromonospora solifontis]